MSLTIWHHIRAKGTVKIEENSIPSVHLPAEAVERIVAPAVIVEVDHLIHRKLCRHQTVRIGYRLRNIGRTRQNNGKNQHDRHGDQDRTPAPTGKLLLHSLKNTGFRFRLRRERGDGSLLFHFRQTGAAFLALCHMGFDLLLAGLAAQPVAV